jgi:hypothetical protein
MDVGIYSFPVFTKTCPLFLSRTEVINSLLIAIYVDVPIYMSLIWRHTFDST